MDEPQFLASLKNQTGAQEGADLDELKSLKIRVPLSLLVNLHFCKLTQSRGISAVIMEALEQYFAKAGGPAWSRSPSQAATPGEASQKKGAAISPWAEAQTPTVAPP